MVNRIAIIASIAERINLPASNGVKFCKLLDQAIALGLSEIALEDARALPADLRDELSIALQNNITRADAAKVAKKWEPKRPVDSQASHTEIAANLIALLQGERQPYSPISCSLSEARGLSTAEKTALTNIIKDIAPAADLKKLAKTWDKLNTNLQSEARTNQVRILISLLYGNCEPVAPPSKEPKKKKAA